MILEPGKTTWRNAAAPHGALIIDMAAYFDAAMEAMSHASHCVHLLNWAFEAGTLFHPQAGCTGPEADRIGNFLIALAEKGVDVRVLCWRSSLPVAATQNFFPVADRKTFAGTKVKFRLDGRLPMGACHHQKAIIIDDALAFAGGGDIGPDRWDTPVHLDDDPRREKTRTDNRCFDSRHEVMGLVDGEAAAALGELFRARWERATGEVLTTCPRGRAPHWPGKIDASFSDLLVGVSRTEAAWKGYAQVRECEALHVAAIRAARSCIYMENQYFTSPLIADELARRLREPEGPEVILVSAEHSPSYFDQATMDRTRVQFLKTLRASDRHQRLRAYGPVTTLGRTIIVHAKLTIIDDVLMRIGSANLNNRSLGYDTECDLSFEAHGPAASDNRAAITKLRNTLLAHWLGCGVDVFDRALEQQAGVGPALDGLRAAGYCRLRPLPVTSLGPVASFIAAFHLGDPVGPADAWRPWKRRKIASREAETVRRSVGRPGKGVARLAK